MVGVVLSPHGEPTRHLREPVAAYLKPIISLQGVDANQLASLVLNLYLTSQVIDISLEESVMATALDIPEITILPSNVPTDDPNRCLYAWKMKLHEESVLDSEDHGDEFDSVTQALTHAYSVFEDLVNNRRLYPSNATQEFKVTVTKG